MTINDWEPHHLSWGDPVGQLFWCGQDLYRGIREPRAALYRDLFGRGIIQGLIQNGLLVDTQLTELSTEEFPLVLQHRVIPTVTFASEWCEVSFKKAALLVLDLELALRRHNLTLTDVNPWNLLLEKASPVYVDLSSIARLTEGGLWQASTQYEQFFLNPVTLYSRGLSRVARRLLYDPWVGISPEDMSLMGLSAGASAPLRQRLGKIVRTKLPMALRPMAKTIRNRFLPKKIIGKGDATSWIRSLRQRIASMPLSGVTTRWAGYYSNNFPALDASSNWTAKHHAVAKIIREKKPLTLLDIGANRGWYSQLAAHEGVRVIATDSDETSINELSTDIEAKNLDVLPLYMDVRFPEAAQGPAYLLFPAAGERLKSEMVLALAIIHHLVFTWHLKFEQIIDNFAIFTKKWLIIEFIGPNDAVVRRDWSASERPWYTLDNLLVALGKYFVVETKMSSDSGGLDYRGDDRTLLICKRKD